MSEVGIIIVLFALGVLILAAEVFIPSHGVLTIAGIGALGLGVVKTFMAGGREAGLIAVISCLVFLPTFAYVAVRVWHRTPLGKRISPPNPVLTAADAGVPVEELTRLIGKTGRALSTLRPVGICDFNGRRISCVVEFGMIEAGAEVLASGLSGGNLTVIERKS